MILHKTKFIKNIPRAHSTTLRVNSKSRGFTLLEVLVATTIFAMIMLITTGTIAQSSTYRSKLKTMREVNEETRKLADQITRDVRSANAPLIYYGAGTDWKFKNGIALLNCVTTGTQFCSLIRYTLEGSSPAELTAGNIWSPDQEANALIISTKDGIKVYINSTDNKAVHYTLYPVGQTITNDALVGTGARNNINNIISSANTETMIKFGGHCPVDDSNPLPPDKNHSYQQSYVQFYITSRTAGYNALPPTQRAQAELRSMVTGRSYNN